MAKYEQFKGWAFAWDRDKPYITRITSWSRSELIRDVEKWMGQPWKKIYRRGGRAIKVTVQEAG